MFILDSKKVYFAPFIINHLEEHFAALNIYKQFSMSFNYLTWVMNCNHMVTLYLISLSLDYCT